MSGSGGDIDLSAFADDERGTTEQLGSFLRHEVQRFGIAVVGGPAAGRAATSTGDRFSIGSHESNDLAIDDPAVSRFHCEVVIDARGAWLVDLESKNGTMVDGVAVGRGALRDGSHIQLGRSSCRFELAAEHVPVPLSARAQLGSLVGASAAMRAVFALLERAAASQVTVLLEGETGTGKEGAAEAIHGESARRERPFLVVDCGAIPATLLERELFGHEKGAFTGADERAAGVFEAAHGGTVLLDEIGELPLELQPKLLRVLEQRQVRPLGATGHKSVDVRIIAATNRDLRALVNDGLFRSDLYFRLAVLTVRIPPLRNRPEDIPLLSQHMLGELGASREVAARLLAPDAMARMQRGAWPGNVRELRNYLERCLVLEQPLPTGESASAPEELAVDTTLSYSEAKRRVLDAFERRYLETLLGRHRGNVAQAARAAGMDRVYVYKLLQRHGLRPKR
jgi:DNA-binding NtrC family response regulator